MGQAGAEGVLTGSGDLGAELLASLLQHRIATTAQLHALHAPALTQRRVLQVLAELERQRFVLRYQPNSRSRVCWFLSADGYRATAAGGEGRQHRMTMTTARAGLRLHTLAVNALGIAFVQAARARGDLCGPWDWRHECLLARRGLGSRDLVADATLDYQAGAHDLTRHIEIDRGTTSAATLVAKLAAYGRVAQSSRRFPPVLVVGADVDREVWDRRVAWVHAGALRTNDVRLADRLNVSFAWLPDVEQYGPFSAVWTDLMRGFGFTAFG